MKTSSNVSEQSRAEQSRADQTRPDQTRQGQIDDGQQQITALLRVVTERPTLPLTEEEAPISKHKNVFKRIKIESWVLTRPKIYSDCAGKASSKLLV
jgi:hypothetical protein